MPNACTAFEWIANAPVQLYSELWAVKRNDRTINDDGDDDLKHTQLKFENLRKDRNEKIIIN